jgi:Superinfection immunity protein
MSDPSSVDPASIIVFLIFLALSLALYFLPTIVGWGKKNRAAIAALNLLLGWTIVGWVVALVWALTKEQSPSVIVASPQFPPAILCRNCGKYSPGNSQACSSCGAPFASQAPATAVTASHV